MGSATSPEPPRSTWFVPGSDEDGCVLHSVEVGRALTAARLVRVGAVDVDARPPPALVADASGAEVVVLCFTDRLYPSDPTALRGWLRALRGRVGCSVIAFAHDIPQDEEGPERADRRRCRYRTLATEVDAIVVSSEHEAALLRPLAPCPIHVAWHYLAPATAGSGASLDRGRPAAAEPEVAVLGHLHPGKGVDLALAAMRGLPEEVGITVLGPVAPGHDGDARALQDEAAACGRRLTISGFLADDVLDRRLRTVSLPVAPHRHISASGSITRWVGRGRRPVVLDGPWVRELLTRHPDCVEPVAPDDLADALSRRWSDPGPTWADPVSRPAGPDVTAAELVAALRATVDRP